MTRGRRPKPTSLHELHGTLNSTRHKARVNEPVAPGDPLLDPPDWLNDGQKDGWRYAIAHAPRNLLKPIDRTMLVVWVVAEDAHRRAVMAQSALDVRNPSMPMLLPRSKGTGEQRTTYFIESPYVRVIQRSAETLMKAVTELGFSPAARPRLVNGDAPPPAAADDPWERMRVLQGGKSTSTTKATARTH